MTALVPVDPSSAVAVTSYLEQAKTWLTTAVETASPEQVSLAKAEMATVAEATKQLNLSKDIQFEAVEMLRLAEYTLGKAIRKGQADGLIRKHGDNQHSVKEVEDIDLQKKSPYDYASRSDLQGGGSRDRRTPGILEIADSTETTEEFVEVLKEAREEGNLSRANVARKAGAAPGKVVTRDMRAEMIVNLANQGYSSRQMPAKVGVTEETIRKIAREFDIDIPADRAIGRTRRVDSNHIVANTVTALEGLVMGVELVVIGDLDPREASQWADSLNHSLRALTKFTKQIKEHAHD